MQDTQVSQLINGQTWSHGKKIYILLKCVFLSLLKTRFHHSHREKTKESKKKKGLEPLKTKKSSQFAQHTWHTHTDTLSVRQNPLPRTQHMGQKGVPPPGHQHRHHRHPATEEK